MLEELNDKNADIRGLAERAVKDKNLFKEFIDGLAVKNETYRYNCSKILNIVSEDHPDLIYPYWANLVNLITSPNSLHKMCAVYLLSRIINTDKEHKFNQIFDIYFSLLNDKHISVAYYVTVAAGRIAKARPDLQTRITQKLLKFSGPGKNHVSNEMVKSAIIESFDGYYETSADKEKIMNYVKDQVVSDSPKTKKAAKAFVRKWGK